MNLERLRHATQAISFFISNLGVNYALKTGSVYPFLYCYGCPLAVGACPIGALQNFTILRICPLYLLGVLGVSGAIFGSMGALVYAYPRDEVVMPIPLGIIMVLRRVKVIYAVLIFAALETILVFIGTQDQTAHLAHIGGLIGGQIVRFSNNCMHATKVYQLFP